MIIMMNSNAKSRTIRNRLCQEIMNNIDLPWATRIQLLDLVDAAETEAWRDGAESFGANPGWWDGPVVVRDNRGRAQEAAAEAAGAA